MMNPFIVSASVGGAGEQVTLPMGGESMWEKITTGAGKFLTGIFTPVSTEIQNSDIALAFLSVTFIGLSVGLFKRFVRALGRGH